MANSLVLLGQQLRELWKHFGVNQKVSTILALLVVAGITAGILIWSSRPSYSLLYAGMDLADAAAAREKLTEDRIPVQIRDSGHSLYVAAADVYRARLLLATAGLPKKSSSGFELFEEPKFGLTDFAQRVNYQRALQGELERTIAAMDGIESARVMLVLPSEKVFASEKEKKASASIMLNVSHGGGLAPVQVRSIKQLVGSAVPGLTSSAITVTDQYGALLSQAQDQGLAESGSGGDQLEIQRNYEKQLAEKAQNMLDMALGAGNAIVKVSVLMDFSKVEKTSEKYDKENRVVVSEKIKSEVTSSANPSAAGGVIATVPVGNPSNVTVGQAENKTKTEDISTEYKVPANVERTVENGARLKSISVSVCLAKMAADRTSQELDGVKQLVRSALGLVEAGDRKDMIEVVEMKFAAATPPPPPSLIEKLPVSPGTILNGLGALVLLVMIIVMSKRISARLSVTSEEAGVQVASLAATNAGGLNSGMAGGGQPENTLDYLSRLAEHNPKAIAQWINNTARLQR
jgi:flagellar M-ring protein FliF